MNSTGHVLQDASTALPGVGQRVDWSPDEAAPPPQAESVKPPREGLLGEVERLSHRHDAANHEQYIRVVVEFATGCLTDPEAIKLAIESAAKTIDDFEADVEIYGKRCKLLKSISNEAEQQQRCTELDEVVRDAERLRMAAGKRLLAAKAEIDEFDLAKHTAQQEQLGIQQSLAGISNDKRRLQEPPYNMFASPNESQLIEEIADLQACCFTAEKQYSASCDERDVIQKALTEARQRLHHLQSIDYHKAAIAPKEKAARLEQQAEDITSLKGEVTTLTARLQASEQAATEAKRQAAELAEQSKLKQEEFTASIIP